MILTATGLKSIITLKRQQRKAELVTAIFQWQQKAKNFRWVDLSGDMEKAEKK